MEIHANCEKLSEFIVRYANRFEVVFFFLMISVSREKKSVKWKLFGK